VPDPAANVATLGRLVREQKTPLQGRETPRRAVPAHHGAPSFPYASSLPYTQQAGLSFGCGCHCIRLDLFANRQFSAVNMATLLL
jgi:hypothetical protein